MVSCFTLLYNPIDAILSSLVEGQDIDVMEDFMKMKQDFILENGAGTHNFRLGNARKKETEKRSFMVVSQKRCGEN